jgi:hypothetical protein
MDSVQDATPTEEPLKANDLINGHDYSKHGAPVRIARVIACRTNKTGLMRVAYDFMSESNLAFIATVQR